MVLEIISQRLQVICFRLSSGRRSHPMCKAEASHLASQGGIQQVAGHAVDEWKQVVEAVDVDNALCTHHTLSEPN